MVTIRREYKNKIDSNHISERLLSLLHNFMTMGADKLVVAMVNKFKKYWDKNLI